jgi:hypothetical protein
MVSVRPKYLFVCLIFLVVCFCFSAPTVFAADSCTATVSPSSVQTSTDTSFSFGVTNTGDSAITFIKVVRPSTNFSLYGNPVAGWSIDGNDEFVSLSGGSVAPGATVNLSFHATSGNTEAASSDWTVQTNAGSGVVSCTGSLGTAISGMRDIAAPEISDLIVSDITNTTVKVTWTTNEASTSKVNYGLDGDYGTVAEDVSLVTSHSVTVSGLTTNTLYEFEVISADSSGNISRNSQNNFTTASVTSSGSSTVNSVTTTTTTTTTTVVITPTPAPKDTLPPSITVSTNFSKPFLESPTIEGKSADAGAINAGIIGLDYSLDNGKNWLPVENLSGLGTRSVVFDFTPPHLDDGNYQVKIRAKDITGNIGTSKTYALIIDRLPPQVGGTLFSLGPMILKPNTQGYISSIAGIEIEIALSAVGGPTTMDLLYGSEKFSLIKNIESGLWNGLINITTPGNFALKIKSIDGAQNETERTLSTIMALTPGKVTDETGKPISKAKVSIFSYEKTLNDFTLWEAEPYMQKNPQETNEGGEYQSILPAGKYYLEVTAAGMRRLRTEIFEVSEATPITQNFSTELSPFWLRWWSKTVPVSLLNLQTPQISTNHLTGKPISDFDLSTPTIAFSSTSILGKPTIITFISSWEPQTSDQLLALDQFKIKNEGVNVFAVTVQESVSKTDIFRKTGGYTIPIVADPDGILVLPLSLESLPTHLIVDKKGIIKEVVTGYIDENNLLNLLLQ